MRSTKDNVITMRTYVLTPPVRVTEFLYGDDTPDGGGESKLYLYQKDKLKQLS